MHRAALRILSALCRPAGFLALALAAGCAPVSGGTLNGQRIYVLSGTDGTVTALGASAGETSRVPFSVVPRPLAMVSGPRGSLLFLAAVEGAGTTVLQVEPGSRRAAASRAVLRAAGRGAALAAAGDYAAVLYHSSGPDAGTAPCHLAILHLPPGGEDEGSHTLPLCGDGELAGTLQMGMAGGRTLILAGITRYRAATDGGAAGAPATGGVGGRVVALDAASGAPVASSPLLGSPGALALESLAGGAPSDTGRRLYVAETQSGPEGEHSPARWRLLTFHASTLALEVVQPLATPVRRLAMAGDGRHAFALSQDGHEVRVVELQTGVDRSFALLAGEALDIVVANGHVYAVGPSGGGWMISRHTRRVTGLRLGGRPIALAAAGHIGERR